MIITEKKILSEPNLPFLQIVSPRRHSFTFILCPSSAFRLACSKVGTGAGRANSHRWWWWWSEHLRPGTRKRGDDFECLRTSSRGNRKRFFRFELWDDFGLRRLCTNLCAVGASPAPSDVAVARSRGKVEAEGGWFAIGVTHHCSCGAKSKSARECLAMT